MEMETVCDAHPVTRRSPLRAWNATWDNSLFCSPAASRIVPRNIYVEDCSLHLYEVYIYVYIPINFVISLHLEFEVCGIPRDPHSPFPVEQLIHQVIDKHEPLMDDPPSLIIAADGSDLRQVSIAACLEVISIPSIPL